MAKSVGKKIKLIEREGKDIKVRGKRKKRGKKKNLVMYIKMIAQKYGETLFPLFIIQAKKFGRNIQELRYMCRSMFLTTSYYVLYVAR